MDEVKKPEETILASMSDDLAKDKISDLFGMDRVDRKEMDLKLTDILSFFKKQSTNIDDVLDGINSLKTRLKAPVFGEKPINAFYRHVFLLMEKDRLEKRIADTTNGNA